MQHCNNYDIPVMKTQEYLIFTVHEILQRIKLLPFEQKQDFYNLFESSSHSELAAYCNIRSPYRLFILTMNHCYHIYQQYSLLFPFLSKIVNSFESGRTLINAFRNLTLPPNLSKEKVLNTRNYLLFNHYKHNSLIRIDINQESHGNEIAIIGTFVTLENNHNKLHLIPYEKGIVEQNGNKIEQMQISGSSSKHYLLSQRKQTNNNFVEFSIADDDAHSKPENPFTWFCALVVEIESKT